MTMPFVNIQLKEGRTPAQKKEVAEAIIDLMDQLDFAKAESIRVIFEDMAEEDFYQGQAK
jgi:4-oxalocrotonate tautomerase